MPVECRGNQFTMPRRRRFKPRNDCVAILGKLSSLYFLSFSSYYVYIPSNLPLAKGGYKYPLADLSCLDQGCIFRDRRDQGDQRDLREASSRFRGVTNRQADKQTNTNRALLCGNAICLSLSSYCRYRRIYLSSLLSLLVILWVILSLSEESPMR